MQQYASFTGVLKTILIILLIYYGIRIVTRFFAPFILKYLSKKVEKRFGQQFGNPYRDEQTTSKKEGEVSIDKMPQQSKSNKNVGEYVDYEEID
ncbi:MAG TPA: DUF4834 family protein [Flavobacteriaceae bacterium]|nr:DUF4834 family protein [Flavobacteriaceae bacterium]